MATGRLAHEKFTDSAVGALLDELRPYEESCPTIQTSSLIRVTRREYARSTRIPAAFVAQLNEHQAEAYKWTAAAGNDFKRVQPYLEKTLELSRQLANYFPATSTSPIR